MPIIRIIDFETTGTEEDSAEVCEYGYSDLDVESGEISDPHGSLCEVAAMPPEVRAVHHISLEETQGFPAFDASFLDSESIDVYAAHNAEFELQFYKPKYMICTYKAALRIWPAAPSHKNGVLLYWLMDLGLISPELPKTQPAHRAGPDAYTTAHVLKAMIDTGVTARQMVEWSMEPPVLPACPIGKQRGQKWPEIETGFLEWMLRQESMEEDLKWNARRELERRNSS